MTGNLWNGKADFMSASQYSLLLVKISTAVWINISTFPFAVQVLLVYESNLYSHSVTFCKISGSENWLSLKFNTKVLSLKYILIIWFTVPIEEICINQCMLLKCLAKALRSVSFTMVILWKEKLTWRLYNMLCNWRGKTALIKSIFLGSNDV